MKKTIMLVCAAGMSTSLMVTKMQKAAEAKGIEADIFAVSASEADSYLNEKKVRYWIRCNTNDRLRYDEWRKSIGSSYKIN